MKIVKKILLLIFSGIIIFIIGFALFYKFVILEDLKRIHNRPVWNYEAEDGYAPFKFSIHKGWVPDKEEKYIRADRKISPELPVSIFTLQWDKISKVLQGSKVSIDEYVVNQWKSQGAQVLSVKDFDLGDFKGKDFLVKANVTKNGVTRLLVCRVIHFTAGDFLYKFQLYTFEKDYDIANKEFERMVKSFRFTQNK